MLCCCCCCSVEISSSVALWISSIFFSFCFFFSSSSAGYLGAQSTLVQPQYMCWIYLLLKSTKKKTTEIQKKKWKNFFLPWLRSLCFVSLRKYNNAFRWFLIYTLTAYCVFLSVVVVLLFCFFFYFARFSVFRVCWFPVWTYSFASVTMCSANCTLSECGWICSLRYTQNTRLFFMNSTDRLNGNSSIHRFLAVSKSSSSSSGSSEREARQRATTKYTVVRHTCVRASDSVFGVYMG